MSMIERKHTGARNEMIACAFLLCEGYEVFRNVSPHGIIDVIGMRGGLVTYFDVKGISDSSSKSPLSNDMLSQEQILAGVKRLNVFPDGSCSIVENPRSKEDRRAAIVCVECKGKFIPGIARNVRFCGSKCRASFHNAKNALAARQSA